MKTTALNTLDLAFTGLETISEFDYVALGETAINVTASTAAIVVGFCSYVWLALQLFWEDHGETITVGSVKFTFGLVDFAGECLLAGRSFRRFANGLTANLTDRVYYLAAGY